MVDLPALAPHVQAALHPPAVVAQATQQSEQPEPELIISYRHLRLDAQNEIATYSGDVRLTYGPSTLTCEVLEYDRKNRRGKASGKVVLIDPEGTMKAVDIEFQLTPVREGSDKLRLLTGNAREVELELDGMKLKIDSIQAEPSEKDTAITMNGVYATPSRTKPPEFAITAKQVRLRSGKSGVAIQPGLDLFGKRIGKVPYLTFSLDKRVTGFRIPAVTFQRGQGVGISWGSTFLLNDQTSITGKWNALPKSLPSLTLEVASTPIDPEKFLGRLTTRNDLYDRYQDSWTDSIQVPDQDREVRMLRMPRRTTSAGIYTNQATRGRADDSEEITKRLDLAGEIGGALGKRGGYLVQLRGQSIRPDNDARFTERIVGAGTFHSGSYPLASGIALQSRWDFTSTLAERESYSWLRGSVALVAKPLSIAQVAIGTTKTWEAGRPQFAFDEPFIKDSLFARADVNFGSIAGGALVKYDIRRKDWVDVEYTASFVAGSFEPYLTYRQFPREVQFGVRLRATQIFERLSARKLTRKSGPQPGTRSGTNP